MSEMFRNLAEFMDISVTFISPYRPKSNSVCETANRLILERLLTVMQEFPDSTWEELLPAIRFGMTVAIQPSGHSAF